jgi:hypothetical protein
MPKTRTYGLDNDTLAYAARVKAGSGKTILPENLKQINKFVVGIKKLGLWNSMVCYPMRSIHNAGTGSTVYSLGGLGVYNGTMVNGPTWQSDGSGIFFDQVVNYKRVSIPIRTTGWTQASLAAVFKTTDILPFTLMVTLDNFQTTNDFSAKLSLGIFQSNGQTLIRSMGLTVGDGSRLARISGLPTPSGYNYFMGQTDNIYDPANGNYLVQQNTTSSNVQIGTGNLPYSVDGTDSFLFNTYNTTASRADTAAFAVIFRTTLGLNTSNLVRQLFRQTIGTGLNLPY